MTTEYDDLVETLIFLITRRLESKREFTRGLLGDGLGNVDVPGREGYSYVRPDRSSNKILEIFNKRVFSADGTPVLIGEIPWQPGLSQCLDIDWDTYLTVGWPNRFAGIAQHGDTHVWRDGFIGEDPFSVYRRQIFDLRTEPIGSGTTSVIVTPYGINDAGTLKTWPGSPGIDLAAAIPGTTGTVRNALVYWDYSGETLYGALGIATGTLDTVTETSIPPKPVEPVGSIPSAYVQLQGGQAQITEADIKDARPIFSTPTPGNDGIKVSKVWRSNFGSVALSADANGNIGIGTIAPEKKLHVKGDPTADIVFEKTGQTARGYSALTGNTIQYAINRDITGTFSDVAKSSATINLTASSNNSRITFFTGPTNNVDPLERMRIDKDGKVGIGTAGPDAKLDVLATTEQFRLTHTDGSKYASFTLDTNENLTILPSNTGQILVPVGSVIAGNNPGLAFNGIGDTGLAANAANFAFWESGKLALMLVDTLSEIRVPSDFVYSWSSATNNNAASDTSWYRNSAGVIRTASDLIIDGNVGIGITTPQGIIHTYDTISGSLKWEYDGLNATVRTVIPNGAGDVLYIAQIDWVMRTSGGTQSSGGSAVPGGSLGANFGGVTVTINVNADGSVTISRTAGAVTVKVALTLRWL